MGYDFTDTINAYREKCAARLQEAVPGSAEQSAYSQMLPEFDKDKDLPSGVRAPGIAVMLTALYRASRHREIRVIIKKFADDFIRDTHMDQPNVHFL